MQPEKLAKIADEALLAASVFMAKLCPKRFPNPHTGAETLRDEFEVWSTRMETVLGSELYTEDETDAAGGCDRGVQMTPHPFKAKRQPKQQRKVLQ